VQCDKKPWNFRSIIVDKVAMNLLGCFDIVDERANYLVFQATEYCGVEQFWIGVRGCKDCARFDCFTPYQVEDVWLSH